ncbi:hypothetical protein FB451DRAFT_1177747 [Mycena latifolia]|nr:hypothetical protein FB451DRAFT_1177747 [Mycena latifolia]
MTGSPILVPHKYLGVMGAIVGYSGNTSFVDNYQTQDKQNVGEPHDGPCLMYAPGIFGSHRSRIQVQDEWNCLIPLGKNEQRPEAYYGSLRVNPPLRSFQHISSTKYEELLMNISVILLKEAYQLGGLKNITDPVREVGRRPWPYLKREALEIIEEAPQWGTRKLNIEGNEHESQHKVEHWKLDTDVGGHRLPEGFQRIGWSPEFHLYLIFIQEKYGDLKHYS